MMNRHVAQIPQCTSPISHDAPFCNRNVHMRAATHVSLKKDRYSSNEILKQIWFNLNDRFLFTITQKFGFLSYVWIDK